jgi:hypothetical protein
MKKIFYIKSLLFLLLAVVNVGCVEPYALQTNTFEEALVVEATITNEFKKQEVKISKTYRFEEDGPTFEAGATVFVTDNNGNQYEFEEQSDKYVSTTEFQAVSGREYQLNITTNDGKTYSSKTESLTTANQIESVNAAVATIDGVTGVQITVNNFDPTNTSKYYRYEYEETSKVTAPLWKPLKAVVMPPNEEINHRFIELVQRETEARICYSLAKSNTLLLTSTNLQSEDRVIDFPVRFISNQDYIIAERYSILVKQYVQNLESYTFYKTLSEISGTGSILSQNQPGFFYGNIRSIENPSEKVIGFFDVASVSTKRIFFNYHDHFPGAQYPPYLDECTEFEFAYCFDAPPAACDGTRLNGLVTSNSLVYLLHSGITYTYIKPICGDCASFSSNVRPEFWID